ncbi:uncharacterized protein LOC131684682 [Topomyia yanbarensis]|uniref:uncharacterized protein LOC131684682 n=1 Tax=Topomyia yanbarensis TaxID=2498891 RepID=UPI00273C7428|nr:uncharacterized protein LOC131684682 [Topomyia yanbarensis]
MSLRLLSSSYVSRLLLSNGAKMAPTRGMARSPYSDPRGFTFTSMKKNPAVIPLVAIIGLAVSGVCGFIVYSFYTRPDVSFNRKVYEWDTMDVMKPKQLKIFAFNQQVQPMPELNEALAYREEYKKQETADH